MRADSHGLFRTPLTGRRLRSRKRCYGSVEQSEELREHEATEDDELHAKNRLHSSLPKRRKRIFRAKDRPTTWLLDQLSRLTLKQIL